MAYYMRNKPDVAAIFKTLVADARADGSSSVVKCACVRSDGSCEFHINGTFGNLCRDRGIRKDLTTANTPERNAVADRAIGLMKSVARSARLHESGVASEP